MARGPGITPPSSGPRLRRSHRAYCAAGALLGIKRRAARQIEAKHGWKVRVCDLRWLVPLNETWIREQAASAKRILIVDEGRHSAGVGEGIVTAVVEGGFGARPFQRVAGADTFTPLAGAAFLVIPSEDQIIAAAATL